MSLICGHTLSKPWATSHISQMNSGSCPQSIPQFSLYYDEGRWWGSSSTGFWDASSSPPHPAPPLFSPTLILWEGKACISSPVLLLINMLRQKGLAFTAT